jgi:antirestriction protein
VKPAVESDRLEPAIWIGDLAAYNSGILHGEWVKLEPEMTLEDLNSKVQKILADGTRRYQKETLSEKHEEWGIFDYEGFGPIKVREYESLESVLKHAHHIADDTDKYFAFIDAMGEDYSEWYESYEGCGPYESKSEYAWNDLEELLLGPDTLSEWLQRRGLTAAMASSMKFDTDEYIRWVENDGTTFGEYNGKFYAFYSIR